MIQRIQSVYLVLSFCAMVICFMFPVATFEATGERGQKVESQLFLISKGQDHEQNLLKDIESGEAQITMPQEGFIHSWPLAAVGGLCGAIALVSIFLYRNRMRQVRVVACGFLLNVIYLFLTFIWLVDSYEEQFARFAEKFQCVETSTTYSVATWASVASLVCFFLAQRAIKRDEAKVRAADRIR